MGKSMRIYRPTNIWVIRYGGLAIDPDAEPICITVTTEYCAMNVLNRISEALETAYPYETWLEDMENKRGKSKYRKESLFNSKVFVEAQKTPFCDETPCLPNIDKLEGGK